MNIQEYMAFARECKRKIPKSTHPEIRKSRRLIFSINEINNYLQTALWEYVWGDISEEELVFIYITLGKKKG